MKIQTIQQRLREARQITGGRYTFTLVEEPDEDKHYLTHWDRPNPWGHEDCAAVAIGDVDHCLRKLDEYVPQWQARQRAREIAEQRKLDEIGMTLGLIPVRPTQPMAAE